MKDGIVEFLRKRDYVLVKELGEGACGKTVLLHDDVLDEDFVCKKYSPYLRHIGHLYIQHSSARLSSFIVYTIRTL